MQTLPVTVTVAENGAVTIEGPSRIVAMSRWSERAGRLSQDFGPGIHKIATEQDVEDLPIGVWADIQDALA